jgi:hypothetical protein
MNGLQLTVRLFAFTDRSGFAVPRRGAVKVWSAAVERMVVQRLAPVLTGPKARPGLAEIRLDLSPDGQLAAADVETGSGAFGPDTVLTSGLMSGSRFPALPAAVRDADFLLLVECVPVPEAAESPA